MKTLMHRDVLLNPLRAALTFDDGSVEYDFGCVEASEILSLETRGLAQKNDLGQWVGYPIMEKMELVYRFNRMTVGISYLGEDRDGKSMFDFVVRVPLSDDGTYTEFRSNCKNYLAHVPRHWDRVRIAAECAWWMCLGEDEISDPFDPALTPAQLRWVRSHLREEYQIAIEKWIEHFDRNTLAEYDDADFAPTLIEVDSGTIQPTPVAPSNAQYVYELACTLQTNSVLHNQTTVVNFLLEHNYVTWEQIENLYPNPYKMSARELVDEFDDQRGTGIWRTVLEIEDVTAYGLPDNSTREDRRALVAILQPSQLTDNDLGLLRDRASDLFEARNILEWWLVDEILHGKLRDLGEPVLSDGNCHWWGRLKSGQDILHDGVLQRVAQRLLAE